jgi:RND family efflux transporter MFP subunit
MKAVIGVVALLLAGLLAVGIIPRISRSRELEAEFSSVNAPPLVNTVVVKRAGPTSNLELPGSIEGLHEAPLYARSSGYVARWLTDIGARVKTGQLLAQIESPEIDQQASQAKADLAQLEANLTLAKRTLDRWKELAHDSVVTELDVDTRQAAFDVAKANLTAGQAAYQRLAELQRFERVTAPFDGVVTARNVDIGTLVAAGTTSAKPLFSVARTDTVRIYVDVPQSALTMVQAGAKVDVLVRELPNGVFPGAVARNARALDAASRTLLTEVQIANPKGVLLPGMFANVRFQVTNPTPAVLIPANTLVVRTEGPQAAVIGPKNVVHYQKLELGRDFGNQVEVVGGLQDGDKLVVNPSDEVRDGVTVRVLPPVDDQRQR